MPASSRTTTSIAGRPAATLMCICLGAGLAGLGSCVALSEFWNPNIRKHSVVVSDDPTRPRVTSRSNLIGEKTNFHVSFGERNYVGGANGIEFYAIEALHGAANSTKPLSYCLSATITNSTPQLTSALRTILPHHNPILDRVSFEIGIVPRGIQFRIKDTQYAGETLPIRLFFPAMADDDNCRSWWLDILNVFAHEYAHVWMTVDGFETANRVSEEFFAYTVARCSMSSIASFQELNLTGIHFGENGADFETIYSAILKNFNNATGAKMPAGQKGMILADLHIFEILDRNIPLSVTDEQKRALDSFCASVANKPVDVTKTSFFRATRAKSNELSPLSNWLQNSN